MDQEKLLAEINSYTYESLNSIWCKGNYISNINCHSYDNSDQLPKNYLQNPSDLDNQLALIKVYIEYNLYLFTPESFYYHDEFRDARWTKVSKEEATKMLDLLVEYSFYHIELAKEQAQKERAEWLFDFGFKSMEDYESASLELKEEVRLSYFYEIYHLNQKGEPLFDFTDFEGLKITFLEALFNEPVSFFVNMPLDKVTAALLKEEEPPALIAMDSEKMAMCWFYY